jgi:hypothetical protein
MWGQGGEGDGTLSGLSYLPHAYQGVRLGSIAALPTSNKNDKNARFITCNAERPPSECNWLLQTRLRR